ncbi:MAG: hypothetical protein CW335_00125 [Clostridiales bacterium]|nr:hypothetical protein [Clostridiales bacterium]
MKRLICILCLLGILAFPTAAEEDTPKYIALTFDDGPSGCYTERLLDELRKREIHATFFLCGYRVEQYPALAAQIAADGHEIGCHSDRHSFLDQLSPEEVCRDLSAAREKIVEATGQEPTLLRPPGGQYDAEVLSETCCADLPIILWSVDPCDWCCKDTQKIADRVIKKVKSGDIILMHDMSRSSVDAALRVIDTLEEKGFEFVTVSELAYLHGVTLQGSEAYHRFSKKEVISSHDAATEPCAKKGFPPPLP